MKIANRESPWQNINVNIGVGDEEEKNTRCLGKISDEFVWGRKDKSHSGFGVVIGDWGQ